MAEKITGIELNGKLYSFYSLGMPVYEELGITLERFAELLERDAYCPTLKSEPTSTDLTYTDTDGSVNHFSVGQLCRWEESGSYRFAICRNIADSEVSWYILPTKVSELTNDAGYLTEHQDISGLATKSELSQKQDKISNNVTYSGTLTSGRVAVLDGTSGVIKDSGYTIATSVPSGAKFTDTTYGNATTSASGLMSSSDKSKLDGIAEGATANVGTITGITMNGASKGNSGVVDLGTVITAHQDISGKVDKVTGKGLSTNDYTTTEKNKLAGIASGAEVNVQSDWSVTDTTSDAYIKNKPTIPSAVSESTVSGWGFTKNAGTITGIKMNGASKGTSGVVDLGAVITSHQDISGKLDVSTAASTYATKTALSQLQTQIDTLVGGDSASAIESFNEIIAFLEGVEDTETLEGIIAGINAEIAKKADKTAATTSAAGLMSASDKTKLNGIASGAEVNVQSDWSVTDTTSDAYIKNKPTIPSAVSESTVSGWGFTKNAGTITGIKMNGSSKGASGVVDLGTVITAHQDISGKVDKVDGKGLSTNDYTTTEKNKLAGIAEGANNYSLPTASSSLGGVKTTSTVTSTSGLTATPIINGVPYYKDTTYTSLKNPNALTVQYNGTSSYTYDGSAAKTLNIKAGSNVSVSGDTSGNITINATDTTYTALKNPNSLTLKYNGTTSYSYDGSAAKILNIKPGSNVSVTGDTSGNITISATDTVYTLPTASSTLGGVKTTSTVTSTSGLTATPIIDGVPYYKNTTYSSLKNPNALTVQYNGTSSYTYDGSAAKTLNIKAGSNVSVSGDTSGNITINATDTTYTSLKNPNSLTLKYNGTTSYSYDGSAAKILNIKPGSNVSVTGDTSGNITISATDTVYTLPTASSTLGGVKTTSTVTSTSGLTATPIINGVPYYKDTTYTSLKNPNALTVQYNGTSSYTYDGSAAKTLNIKPGSNVSVTGDASGNITIAATNTTYSSMSESEANTGTATTGRLITAQRLHNKINKVLSDGIFVNYAGEYVVDKTYPAGAWVKFGGGDYIAKKSTSLPPIAIAALSSTALALVSTNTYALMGGYEEYGNKDDWFEINPASGSVKRTSASVTLAKGDQKVICSNSSAITVTLPLAPHDGCEIWIAARSGNVTVAPSSGDSLLGGNKTLTSSSGWGVYIYDVQNAQWLFK